jgi:hypothetical protein
VRVYHEKNASEHVSITQVTQSHNLLTTLGVHREIHPTSLVLVPTGPQGLIRRKD